MTVLPYTARFLPEVSQICLETADPALKSTAKKEQILLEQYCTYYTRHEPGFCFVLLDEKAACVAGYVLCTPNFHRFFRVFARENVCRIVRLSLVQGVQAAVIAGAYRMYCRQYPAHLHIDLLEKYTHCGGGTQLMRALFQKLRACGVPGVCLCVASGNVRAVSFYQKMGFSVLRHFPGSYFMGKKLE